MSGYDHWYIWHTDPKTKVTKYNGEFVDAEAALAWKAKQANPDEYEITNKGPSAIVREKKLFPWDKDTAEGQQKQRHYEAVAPYLDKKSGSQDARRHRGDERHDRGAIKPPRRTAPAAPVEPPKPKTKAELRLEADAKALLDQHKGDEAAELAAKTTDA